MKRFVANIYNEALRFRGCFVGFTYIYIYISAHKKKCPQRLVGKKVPRRSLWAQKCPEALVGTLMPRSPCGHSACPEAVMGTFFKIIQLCIKNYLNT